MRTRLLKISLISVLALLLYACAVGPKYERPEITSPNKFLYDTLVTQDSVLNLKWWEMFNDPILDSLIIIALDNNQDALIAASRVSQARSNVGYNKADYLPKFNVEGGTAQGNYGGGFLTFEDQRSAFLLNGQVAWELDFWGKFRRSTESAKAELLGTEYGLRNVQISIISEVAANYFRLLNAKTKYKISKDTYTSRDSGHKIIEARYLGGMIPEIDVNQSQIQLSVAQASIPLYDREITFSENNLSLLLGQIPDSFEFNKTIFEQDIEVEIPSGIPSTLLNRRPDILESEATLHAQTARIGVAQANRLPSISLTGLLGSVSSDLTSFGTGGTSWSAGVNIFGPLFHWGKNKRKVEIEREKTLQAVYAYEKSVLNAFREVENALKSIETYDSELAAREDQYSAATSAESLSFERYNGGVSSYLEVLENQRSSFDAQLVYVETYQQLIDSYIKLYKALGGGWISEEEMKEAEATASEKKK